MDILCCKCGFSIYFEVICITIFTYIFVNCVFVLYRVPEIGEDLPSNNPHLSADGLPEFSSVTIEKCIAIIGKQALDVEKTVKKCEEVLETNGGKNVDLFADVLRPIEESEAQLETTWGLAKCLYLGNSTLMPTKSYLLINERARKARFNKFNSLPVYAAISDALANPTTKFNEEQQRLLSKYMLEGKLNGVALSSSNKAVLYKTMDKLREERGKFQGKVDLSVRNFSHIIPDYNQVREFPTDVLQSLSADPANPTQGPWKVTLQHNVYNSFLAHCQDRTLRWNLWQAQTRLCSGFSEKSLSNSVHLEEIRHLRQTQARLLGYESFMDMSLETKMAGSIGEVRAVLDDLLDYARPAQEKELNALQDFAALGGESNRLELFDVPFWQRKQLKSQHKYDEDIIREYFPLPKVLEGVYEMFEHLFRIKIVEREVVSTWHKDVKFFDVFDLSDGARTPVAGFYLDLYSREDDKHRGNKGLVVGIRNRDRFSNNVPLAALVFNFSDPLYGKPSLLSFGDVQTLFQKFGRSLQHLLTRVSYNDLAGLSNIEWDAVEVGEHLMTHLIYHGDNIKRISGHFTSNEPIPDELIAAIQEQRRSLAGFRLSRELYVAALDVELHSSQDFWLEVVRRLYPQYHVMGLDKKDAHPCSLVDIFSGSWGGAYFGHVWSRMVAADVYGAFDEARGVAEQEQQVGERYRDTFLALGGAHHASDVFRKFRGRDPSSQALVKSLGLNRTTVVTDEKTAA